MTLDEAIEERLKVIKVQEKLYEESYSDESKEIIKSATDNDRQLVEWLMELKELKNSIGTVKLKDMKEAVELLQELNTENDQLTSQLANAKRLLKAAVEDLNSIGRMLEGNDILCMKYIACEGCPFNGENCNKWKHADEALKLIGND